VIVIFFTVIAASCVHAGSGLAASLPMVGIGLLMAVGVRVWAAIFAKRNSPCFKKLTTKSVAIKVPGKGKVTCDI
jgi:hypothetical protein